MIENLTPEQQADYVRILAETQTPQSTAQFYPMATNEERAELRSLGYTEKEIGAMPYDVIHARVADLKKNGNGHHAPIDVPPELAALPQWVVWKRETRNGSKAKHPYQPNGRSAKPDDPTTWSDFQTCAAAVGQYDGLGLMFGQTLAGLDFDGCLDDAGSLLPWAREYLDLCPVTYTELSPSGKGLHLFYQGALPDGLRGKRKDFGEHVGIEAYSYPSNRYFTFTGKPWGSPQPVAMITPEQFAPLRDKLFPQVSETAPAATIAQPSISMDDWEVIRRATNARNGAGDKFVKLMTGDISGYDNDESDADVALCNYLAAWTRDAAQIERIWRSSGLRQGDPKIERDDYRARTINKALADVRPYDPDHYKKQAAANAQNSAPAASAAAAQANPKGYTLHWASEALQPQPPIEWIVNGLLSAGTVSLVVGEGGSKKTWSMLDLATAVANGEKWLDFDTQRSTVLLIDEESGKPRLLRRVGNTLRGHNAGPSTPIAWVAFEGVNLQQPYHQHEIENIIKATKARLIIIDALIDVIGDADENAASEIAPIFHALRVIADNTKSAIVVIHHAGKTGNYRGSSAMKGAVDLLITIESKPDATRVDFDIEKARDIEPLKFSGLANFGLDTFNLSPATTTAKAEHFSKAEEFVMRYLEAHSEAEINEIANSADTCTFEAARRAVFSLAQRGKVCRTNSGGKGTAAIYALPIGSTK